MMKFGKGVTEKVVSTRMLRENNAEFKDLSFQKVASILRKEGYIKYKTAINYEGTYHNVWFKNCRKTQVNKTFRLSMLEKN